MFWGHNIIYGQCEELIKMMDKVNPSSFEYIQTDLSLGDSSEEEGIRALIVWLMVQRVLNAVH
jgi:hypothetical protein